MTLKHKYQLLLFSVVISVPLSLIVINFIMMGIYHIAYGSKNVLFHESFAYTAMMVLFGLSFFLLAFVFSKSINSLLTKINLLNRTIRDLASNEQLPSKLEVKQEDELGELIKSVNLLIDRTAYRELELQQQEEIKKELLQKLRHDINTPLTAVRLQLFYLENQFAGQVSLFESLYGQIDYIAELTNEFTVQSGETLEDSYLVQTEVAVSDLLATMVTKWSYLYSVEEIALCYHPKNNVLLWKSNNLWLQRLFDNIFQNALKHSQATKLEVTIEDNMVTIQDNGIGFDLGRPANGMGLKIIKDIAQLLQLDYKVQSCEKGTLFCLASRANAMPKEIRKG